HAIKNIPIKATKNDLIDRTLTDFARETHESTLKIYFPLCALMVLFSYFSCISRANFLFPYFLSIYGRA
ncbi:MAG TPA: hypothetical protein VL325_09625, partial [Pyrinomonadaceae bacterium]|nr:hypothetical protein [Pyrinomonadaceae bacterium]